MFVHLLQRIQKEIIELLAKDKDFWIRASVSKNSNIPKEILEILAKDKDYLVRAHLLHKIQICQKRQFKSFARISRISPNAKEIFAKNKKFWIRAKN